MIAEPIIRVRNVNKAFDSVHAVQDLSFDIQPGQVVGFIGANGAGKTTTMRMLATLETPDSGSIEVGPFNVLEHPSEVRRLIGWMPDSYGAYAQVSVFDYLDFYARSGGLSGRQRQDRLTEVMEFADLTSLADRPMNGLSKGMAQRLCFGRALLHDPAVLILDEPAAGLDPKARIEFKNLVHLLRKRGTTIFISSHILSELGEMCDSLLFIDGGRVVHHGTAASLQHGHAQTARLLEIRFHGPPEPLLNWLAIHPGWSLLSQNHDLVRAEFHSHDLVDLAAQLRQMILDQIPILDFHHPERRLEEIFVDVLKKHNSPPLPIS